VSAIATTAPDAFVEEVLSRELGETVDSIVRRRGEFEKHTAVEVVTARLAGGRHVELFVKHLGSRQSDHPDQQRRDREARLYEELVSGDGLPLPKCLGARWDESAATGLLVLEHLDGWPLHYHELDQWFAAARRLAELHVHFAARPQSLLDADFVLRLDAHYLSGWAERAVLAVAASYSAELACRLERLVASWERVVAPIVAQPPTLVHNDLSRKNVLVSTATVPARICFVDWEMAGVGCGLLDLVHVRYQRLDAASDRRMLTEYAGQLSGTGLLPADRRELRELFAACELHRTVYRLARCGWWGKPLEYVADRVAAAERLWSGMGA